MKAAKLLTERQEQWRDLETLCAELEKTRARRMTGEHIVNFASLYRAACADLALADAYQLPADTVRYLHQLIGRAHNQLYRSQLFRWRNWFHELFHEVPKRLLVDWTLWLAFAIFWGIFGLAMFLSYSSRDFALSVLGEAMMSQMEENFSKPVAGRDPNMNGIMAGFYVMHNAGIGLKCFASGLLLGVGGLFATVFNAVHLGTAFGFMLNTPSRDNFLTFVTAHGPFELTAIVLSAAAGMRLGFSLVATGGLARSVSLRQAAVQATPTMAAAVIMFGFAALIEGFISPSAAPYEIKAGIAIVSALLLVVYIVGLGLLARN